MLDLIKYMVYVLVAILFIGMLLVLLVMFTLSADAAPLTQFEPRWVCTAFPICWAKLNDAPDVWTAVPVGTKIEWWQVVERWNSDTDWRYETRG